MKAAAAFLVLVIIGSVLAMGVSQDKPVFRTGPRLVRLRLDNTLIMEGEINPISVDTWIAATIGKRVLLPKDEMLYVVVVSPGGQVNASAVLKDFLPRVNNVTLICKYCASAAGMLFVTAAKRLAIAKSILLMHEMYDSHVTAFDILSGAVLSLISQSDEFNAYIYKRLGVTKEFYESKIVGTQWVLAGEAIVMQNGADELVRLSCQPYLATLIPDTCNE